MIKRALVLVGLMLALLAPAAAASPPATAAQAGGSCRWTRQPVPPSTTKRLRCECGRDNPYSPWYLCMRVRR